MAGEDERPGRTRRRLLRIAGRGIPGIFPAAFLAELAQQPDRSIGSQVPELRRNRSIGSVQQELAGIPRRCLAKADGWELVLSAALNRRLLRQWNRTARRPGLRATQDRSKLH